MHRAWWVIPCSILTALGLLILKLAWTEGPEQWFYDRLGPPMLWTAVGMAGFFALAAMIAGGRLYRRRPVPAVAWLAAAMGVFQLATQLYGLPALNPFKSARGLSEVYLETAGSGARYGVYRRADAGFPFYTGQFGAVLESPEELRGFVAGEGRVWVFLHRGHYRELAEEETPPALWEVARDADEDDGYLLVTDRPVDGGTPLDGLRSVTAPTR